MTLGGGWLVVTLTNQSIYRLRPKNKQITVTMRLACQRALSPTDVLRHCDLNDVG